MKHKIHRALARQRGGGHVFVGHRPGRLHAQAGFPRRGKSQPYAHIGQHAPAGHAGGAVMRGHRALLGKRLRVDLPALPVPVRRLRHGAQQIAAVAAQNARRPGGQAAVAPQHPLLVGGLGIDAPLAAGCGIQAPTLGQVLLPACAQGPVAKARLRRGGHVVDQGAAFAAQPQVVAHRQIHRPRQRADLHIARALRAQGEIVVILVGQGVGAV